MSAGQRLPIEGDPTAQLGVSRASMAQAVVALEVDEILSMWQRDGVHLKRAWCWT